MKKKNTKSVKKPVKAKVIETKVDAAVKTDVKTVVKADKKDFATDVVKIISVLGWVGSTFMIIVGLIFIFFRKAILTQIPITQIPPGYESLMPMMVTIMGVCMILFGAAWFIVSMNLWRFKKWARIVAIIFAAIGALSALMSFPAGWFGFLLHGTVFYFLALNPDVKKLFE